MMRFTNYKAVPNKIYIMQDVSVNYPNTVHKLMGRYKSKVRVDGITVILDHRTDLLLNWEKKIYLHYAVVHEFSQKLKRPLRFQLAITYRSLKDPKKNYYFAKVIEVTGFDVTMKKYLETVLPLGGNQAEFNTALERVMQNVPTRMRKATMRIAKDIQNKIKTPHGPPETKVETVS